MRSPFVCFQRLIGRAWLACRLPGQASACSVRAGRARDRSALRARRARRPRACAAARLRRWPRWATRWRARARSVRSPQRTPPNWAPRWRAPPGRRVQEPGRAAGARRPSGAPTLRRRLRRQSQHAALVAERGRATLRATRRAAKRRLGRMRPPRERTPRARRPMLPRLWCRSALMRRAAQGPPALAGPAPTDLRWRSPPGRARAGRAAGGGRRGRRWALPYPTPCSGWLSWRRCRGGRL